MRILLRRWWHEIFAGHEAAAFRQVGGVTLYYCACGTKIGITYANEI
jgi:hypothetical protein